MLVHTIDLHFRNLPHAIAVFVVETPEGKVLIETGPHSTYDALEAAFSERQWHLEDIRDVFLSHIHFDHAGAAWALAKHGARIHVHPRGRAHLAQPERLYNSARQIYGDHMDELWGAMNPIDDGLLYAPEHGETIHAAGLQLTAWYTPGHAIHHIAWEVRAQGHPPVVFTGDVAGVRVDDGPVMPPCPPPDIDVEAWQASLNLLRNLEAEALYLTHYGLVGEKHRHLDVLEKRLLDWATWMRPNAEQGLAPETLVPAFQEYVKNQLIAEGVGEAGLAQYEAANPSFMSVAGLMRYWTKKLQTPKQV
jgi:glyoxylase-like metal-dependent hydrolase (beta-lactamase superfamily II)